MPLWVIDVILLPVSKKPTITRHLSCPTCEYDLFGLVEEQTYRFGLVEESRSVHCPECGEEVDVDWALTLLRGRKVKTTLLWLVLCVAAFVPVACFGVFCIIDAQFWNIGLFVASTVIWMTILVIYTQRHRHVDYAGLVLFMFHGCFVTAAAGGLLVAYVLSCFFPQFSVPWLPYLASRGGIILSLVLAMASFSYAWRLYWQACGLIEDGHDLMLHRMLIPADSGQTVHASKGRAKRKSSTCP